MNLYELNIENSNIWEIRVTDITTVESYRYYIMKHCNSTNLDGVFIWNNNIFLSTNKMKLKEYAEKLKK